MEQTKKFTLTVEHIKLVSHFNVDWNSAENGAPSVDPKRPYGNSRVACDIYEILHGEVVGRATSKKEALSAEEETALLKLHQETKDALQVILATKSFTPGIYEAPNYSHDWKLVGAPVIKPAKAPKKVKASPKE